MAKEQAGTEKVQFADDMMRLFVHFFVAMKKMTFSYENIRLNSLSFVVLYMLHQYDSAKPTIMSKFADRLGIPKQQLTKVINPLEEKKLVSRSHGVDNRRLVYLQITEAGRRMILDCIQALDKEAVQHYGKVPDESLGKFVESIRTLNGIMEHQAALLNREDDYAI